MNESNTMYNSYSESVEYMSSQCDYNNDDCVICLSKINNNDKVKILDCKHKFHEECINGWLEIDNTCPTCRFEIYLKDTNNTNNTENDFNNPLISVRNFYFTCDRHLIYMITISNIASYCIKIINDNNYLNFIVILINFYGFYGAFALNYRCLIIYNFFNIINVFLQTILVINFVSHNPYSLTHRDDIILFFNILHIFVEIIIISIIKRFINKIKDYTNNQNLFLYRHNNR